MIKTFLEKKLLATLVFFLLTLLVFIISKINLDKIDYWGAKNSIIALSFLYPPIFYFLIHEKLVGKITFSLKIVSHLIPFLLFTLIKAFFQLDYSLFEMPDSSLYTFTEELNPISLLYLFKEVQLDAYLVLDLHLIINFSKLSGLFKQYSQEIKFISIVYIAIIIRIILNKLFFKTFFFIDIHFNSLFILCLFGFIYFIIEAIRIFSFLVLEKSPNPLPSTLNEDFIEQQRPILNESLTKLVGKETSNILNLVYKTTIFETDPFPTFTRINLEEIPQKVYQVKIYKYPILGIANSCNGFELIALYIGFLICIDGKWWKKILYIILGSVLIHYANIFRCYALVELVLHNNQFFDLAHHYIYKILLYSFIFSLWYLFLRSDEKLV